MAEAVADIKKVKGILNLNELGNSFDECVESIKTDSISKKEAHIQKKNWK